MTRSLERQRMRSEDHPVKEASQQTSYNLLNLICPRRDTYCDRTAAHISGYKIILIVKELYFY